ncbi:MAG: hypothetical protein Tsb009_15000 [Planctomycetaceae bacterium]
MIDISKAKSFSVFPVELRGDTLIVTPHGDAAGFGTREFQAELNTVLTFLEDPDVHSLIVDLSTSNYYGSQVVGAINSLVLKIRETGGRAGICGVSQDMQAVLETMKLDSLWTFYGTRQDAMAALTTESFGDKLSANLHSRRMRPVLIAVSIAIVLLIGFVAYRLTRPSGREIAQDAYNDFKQIEADLRANREKKLSQRMWNLFMNQSRDKIEKHLEKLEAHPEINEKLTTALTKAGRDALLPMLKNPRNSSDHHSQLFQEQMDIAKKYLAEEDNQ